jgi:hypothetical protein
VKDPPGETWISRYNIGDLVSMTAFVPKLSPAITFTVVLPSEKLEENKSVNIYYICLVFMSSSASKDRQCFICNINVIF